MSLERRMLSGHTKTFGKPWRLGFTTVLAVTSIGEACPATKTLHPDWPWAFVTLAQVAVGTRAVSGVSACVAAPFPGLGQPAHAPRGSLSCNYAD